MANPVVILSQALREIDDACTHYDGRQAGLGNRFRQAIEAVLDLIQRLPEIHAIAFGSYRRATVRGFPYLTYYEYIQGIVTVYSVFHGSQDPARLRGRLP